MSKWFVGEEALPTIEKLVTGLQMKILVAVSKKNSTRYERYVPWMTLPSPSNELISRFAVEHEKLTSDLAFLKLLAKEFYKSDAEALGKLELDSDHVNMYIYQPGNDSPEIKDLFLQGLDLLLQSSVFFEKLYPKIIQTIVPMKVKNSNNSRAAFSSHELKGAIFRAVPNSESPYWRVDLAIDLAHEVGHQVLMVYQAADKIINSDFAEPVISGVRKVPRPAIMSYHAAAALAYIVYYLRDQLSEGAIQRLSEVEIAYAKLELARYENDLRLGLSALEGKCNFTQVGALIFNEYKELIS